MATILLVDDEAPLRNLLRRVLESSGHRVHSAADGLEGLRVGQELLAGLDLLLADICMPGIEGPELARRLRRVRPDLRVLYISGYAETRTLDAPVLRKPFEPAMLLKAIRSMLPAGEDCDGRLSQMRGR